MWAVGRVTCQMFASLVLPGKEREMCARAELCAKNTAIKQGPKIKLVKHPLLHKDSKAVLCNWRWFFFLLWDLNFCTYFGFPACLVASLVFFSLPGVWYLQPPLLWPLPWDLHDIYLSAIRRQNDAKIRKKNWKTSHLNRSRRGLGTDRDVWKPGPHINIQTPLSWCFCSVVQDIVKISL